MTETQRGLGTEPVPTALASVRLRGGPRVLNQPLSHAVPSQKRARWPDAGPGQALPSYGLPSLLMTAVLTPQPRVNPAFSCHLWRRFPPGWPSSWVSVSVHTGSASSG